LKIEKLIACDIDVKMMKLQKLFILAFGIITSCSGNMEKADLIVFNAVIYTVDKEFSIAESAAIKDGRFIATGTDDEILTRYNAAVKLDLEGQYVYPGLIDAHCHFYGYGISLADADLVGAESFDQIIEIIKQHDRNFPAEWITGRGWDQNLWEDKGFPHKKQLDEVFPATPVLLTRIDGHAAIANSAALERAGVNIKTTIQGGEFLAEKGELTGVLIDNAISLVRRHIPSAGYGEKVAALISAQDKCFAVGLTSVADAGLDSGIILLMDSLQKSGDLKMRVYAMINPNTENFENFMLKGIYKTDFMNVRSVKLFADGALGSRGARMIDEYTDQKGHYGLLLESPGILEKISRKAYRYGYQVNTHCIGDSAVRLMLDIYTRILGGPNDLRWRIEHAQVVSPEDLPLFGRYSIVPSVQTTHATSDMQWAVHRLGEARIKNAYAYRLLLEQTGWLPNGSDFPVENINPLYGFYAAVARKDIKGYPGEGFQMENSLTREQALRAMTIWAAKANFEEDEKGSIEPGKFADFIITGKDLMKWEIDEIPGLRIQKTFVGGKEVYSLH
jgi:predicted amidohydrolase YtcJ